MFFNCNQFYQNLLLWTKSCNNKNITNEKGIRNAMQCSKCNAMSSKWNILLNLTANYQEMLLSKELTLLDKGDLSSIKYSNNDWMLSFYVCNRNILASFHDKSIWKIGVEGSGDFVNGNDCFSHMSLMIFMNLTILTLLPML